MNVVLFQPLQDQGKGHEADLNYPEEFLFSTTDVPSLKFRYNKSYMAEMYSVHLQSTQN